MNEDDFYAKSLVLQNYLFDVELTDTVMLITHDKKVYFLSSKKKIEFLEQLMDAEDRGGFTYNFMMRDKSSGNERHYCKIIKAIESVTSSEEDGNIRVGVFAKEWECNKNTVNVSGLQKAISDSDILEIVDVGVGFGIALGVKDQKELNLIKESSMICNNVLSFHVIPRLEEILYTEEKITHEALAEEIEDIYQDLGKINLEIAPDQVGTAYFPIIQSGGEYDMHISALSDSKILKYDIIIVSFGTRYNNYCSNIARTFLIDPPKMVSDTYQLLLQMYHACLKVMVPGKPLKSVYETAVQKLMDTGREHLVKCLPKNLGFSIGAYFREGSFALSAKNNVIFKAGMTFNLAIGMSGIPLLDKDRNQLNDASDVSICQRFIRLFCCIV
jgi:nucleosome binding factor SPN SPT16 subunit